MWPLTSTNYITARGSDQQTPVQSTRQEQLDAGFSAFQFLETQRLIVPTNLETHSVPSKISGVSERFIAKLSEFNQNQQIIYFNDISEKDNFNFTEYEKKLAKIGFTRKEGVIELVYKGDDPAGALDKLMDLDLLITDCRVSLCIIDYLLLKEDVGPQQFNRIIKEYCSGTLDFRPLPIRDQKTHYQYHGRIQENTDLENLEKGDQVYLYGNRVGFGFKPTSEFNGYNLVVIGRNDNNELLFKGFHSFDDEACTYAEIIELFKSKLEEPLTYADLAQIYHMHRSKPDDYTYNCHLTHKEIYESLQSEYSERIDEEILKSLSPNTNKKSASKIKVPTRYLRDSVIGLVFMHQLNPHAYSELTHRNPHKAESLLKIQTISKLVLPQETGFIPNFSQTEKFQKELVGVVHDFYQECIDPQLEKKHLGLVVHGSPGTGKTHCCDFVIKKLETEHGKKIFRKGFHDEMLSKKDYVECLQIIDKHARIDKVIEKLSGQWKDINIFYVDDVNVDISEHNLVTQAILKYAKLHNKKVLINANSNYFDIIQKDYSKFTGFLRVINVIGQDYREQTAWHLGNQVDASSTISKEREWTPDQIKIFEWIQLLDKEDDPEKSNGLLITGKPGTGKTTVIKEALKEKKVQWVNNHTITSFLLQDLQSSNNEYLVIEDINDLRFNYQYKNLLAQICNSDQLKNKDGKPIKIILTSNGKNDLIENLKKDIFLENLGPRMNSRFAEKFKVVSVESTEDMRRPSHTYGAILDKVPGDIQKENILDLKEIFKKLTLLRDTEKYGEMAKYRASIVDQVRLKEQIVINCNAKLSDWRFLQKEFFQILDLMEDEGKQLFIIHDAPEVFKQELKELIRNDSLMPLSDQEKYLSRIGRLESMQSSDCSEVDCDEQLIKAV